MPELSIQWIGPEADDYSCSLPGAFWGARTNRLRDYVAATEKMYGPLRIAASDAILEHLGRGPGGKSVDSCPVFRTPKVKDLPIDIEKVLLAAAGKTCGRGAFEGDRARIALTMATSMLEGLLDVDPALREMAYQLYIARLADETRSLQEEKNHGV